MKKPIRLLILVLTLSLVIVGCSGKGDKETSEDSNTPVQPSENGNKIVVVSREDGSGTRGAFVELTGILEKDAEGNKVDRTTDEAIIQMKTDAVISSIAGDEDSIGYISLGSLNENIKGVKVDGVEPTPENVKSKDYKVVRPFNVATKGEKDPLTEDFMKFILSKEGQEIVSKNYIAVDDALESYEGEEIEGKIVVAGSSSVTPVMELLKEGYLKVNPKAQIEIQLSDSSAGMQAAIDGIADIGMASRELKDSEKEELDEVAIALDGIAIVVNKNNDIDDLSIDEIRDIFIGEITNWSEVK